MKTINKIGLGLALLALSFFGGYLSRTPKEPEAKIQIVYKDRIVEKVVEKVVNRDIKTTISKPDGTKVTVEDRSRIVAKAETKIKEKSVSYSKKESKKNRRVAIQLSPVTGRPESVSGGFRLKDSVWLEAGASRSGVTVGIGFEF